MKMFPAALALFVAFGAGLYAAPADAANARRPYSNVDKRNDKGNPTGDSEVDKLNQQQLDSVRSQSGYVVGAPQPMGAPMMGAPMMQPGMAR